MRKMTFWMAHFFMIYLIKYKFSLSDTIKPVNIRVPCIFSEQLIAIKVGRLERWLSGQFGVRQGRQICTFADWLRCKPLVHRFRWSPFLWVPSTPRRRLKQVLTLAQQVLRLEHARVPSRPFTKLWQLYRPTNRSTDGQTGSKTSYTSNNVFVNQMKGQFFESNIISINMNYRYPKIKHSL